MTILALFSRHISFKFNCSTEFGSLELIVCLHDVNNEADTQQLLALKSFEFDLDLNGFQLPNKEENKSCAKT